MSMSCLKCSYETRDRINIHILKTVVVEFLFLFMPVFRVATVTASSDCQVTSNTTDRPVGNCREAVGPCSAYG